MKNAVIVLSICTMLSLNGQEYGLISFNDAINISGKQRMLSQRITKLYILKNRNIWTDAQQKELIESVRLFNENYKTLKSNATFVNTSIKLALRNENKAWESYSSFLKQIEAEYFEERLVAKSKTLLHSCNALVSAIETLDKNLDLETGRRSAIALQAKTVNISGRQRMLSQQFAVYFLLHSNAYTTDTSVHNQLKDIRNQQRDALSFLIFNSSKSEGIEQELGKVAFMYEKLDDLSLDNTKEETLKVMHYCNHITALFNGITHQYSDFYNSINDPYNQSATIR